MRIVTAEGPIHHDEVVNRLMEFWNHERRGNRLVAAAEQGIRYATRPGGVIRRDGFLFADAQPIRPRNRAELEQGAEWVSLDELSEAARNVLEHADSMSEDQLAAEVREVLGLRRTQDGAPRIRQAIKSLLESGVAIYGVAGLRLRRPAQ
jgi:hypothetical protein